MQKLLSKLKSTNENEKNSHEHTTSACSLTAHSNGPDTKITQNTTLRKHDKPSVESRGSGSTYELPTLALPNDRQGGLPLTSEPSHPSYPMLRRWRKQVTVTASDFSRRVGSVIRSALGKEDTACAGRSDSDRSSPDSRSGWDRVLRSEVRNGKYEQFVKQQDAREYDQIDEREAESGDDGEEEEDVLGGEHWDKTL